MPKYKISELFDFKGEHLLPLMDKPQGTKLPKEVESILSNEEKQEYKLYIKWVRKPKGRGYPL